MLASSPPGVRVGADICPVDAVAESIERFGDRYLRRVYTDAEIADCSGEPRVRAERLAARFAAKEATLKVLRPSGAQPDWRSIEVRRHAGGWTELVLTGAAARLAAEEHVSALALSLSHDGGMALAFVAAVIGGLDG